MSNARSMSALMHVPSPRMHACELTFVVHQPHDPRRVDAQHAAYREMLRRAGIDVRVLEIYPERPDCVFVEDTAIILDEVAVLASMGSASRREEPSGIEPILREYREVQRIPFPATIEGGDVLVSGKTLLVGLSTRTNLAGANALAEIVRPWGYDVVPVPVHGCLHLKTGCCALPDGRLLVNRTWLDAAPLRHFSLLDVPEQEPWGANVVLLPEHIGLAAEHPRTASLLEGLGFRVLTVPLSEFAKAEGGATCLSLLLRG
jgi:dimethylargininase